MSAMRVTVGDSVFQELLSAIFDGRLEPGQRLNDIALAEELGISRTPVREALQKLKSIGVVESEPNRFTRVAVVSPEQVRQHLVVWVALMHAVVDEVGGSVPKSVIRRMETQHARFVRELQELAGMGTGDELLAKRAGKSRRLATANVDFFTSLVGLSSNAPLRAALETAQHVVRLGSLSLPDWVEVVGLERVQSRLLGALAADDVAGSHAAIATLLELTVPGAATTRVR